MNESKVQKLDKALLLIKTRYERDILEVKYPPLAWPPALTLATHCAPDRSHTTALITKECRDTSGDCIPSAIYRAANISIENKALGGFRYYRFRSRWWPSRCAALGQTDEAAAKRGKAGTGMYR